jgi:superfamily II DNA helicase RecQ
MEDLAACILAAIARQERTFIIISPLVGLMADQVRRATELGIKACAINMATLLEDRNLYTKVQDGQFALVYINPESCVSSNQDFRKLVEDATFLESDLSSGPGKRSH